MRLKRKERAETGAFAEPAEAPEERGTEADRDGGPAVQTAPIEGAELLGEAPAPPADEAAPAGGSQPRREGRRWRRRRPGAESPDDDQSSRGDPDTPDGDPDTPEGADAPEGAGVPGDSDAPRDPAVPDDTEPATPQRRRFGRRPRAEPPALPSISDLREDDVDPLDEPWLPGLDDDTPAVACSELVKQFGQGDAAVLALSDITLEFEPRTFSAIMGPSGSGKSTLMHLLAGLDEPTSGTIQIGGVSLEGLSDRKRTALRRARVGFVFQAFNLLPVLSAQENIELPLRVAGARPDPYWVQELLRAFDLTDRRKHRPAELSGGQQQRVAIARALVTQPNVVFADEPTGNIDSAAGEEVLEILETCVSEYGQTVVMVTHDPLAAAHAGRVVFLADGRAVRDERAPSTRRILDVLRERS